MYEKFEILNQDQMLALKGGGIEKLDPKLKTIIWVIDFDDTDDD